MKKIRFGFSVPVNLKTKPFAAAIIWWDNTKKIEGPEISHGYTRFMSMSWGTSFIYQNSGLRTHFMGEKRFLSLNKIVEEYEIEVSEETEKRIGQFIVSREGTPYALKQTAGIAVSGLVWLVSFGKIDIPNPFADGRKETNCIEEMAIILSDEFGVPCPLDVDKMSVRPFRNWLKDLPMVKRVDGTKEETL